MSVTIVENSAPKEMPTLWHSMNEMCVFDVFVHTRSIFLVVVAAAEHPEVPASALLAAAVHVGNATATAPLATQHAWLPVWIPMIWISPFIGIV